MTAALPWLVTAACVAVVLIGLSLLAARIRRRGGGVDIMFVAPAA
jgi:hypothetical protein